MLSNCSIVFSNNTCWLCRDKLHLPRMSFCHKILELKREYVFHSKSFWKLLFISYPKDCSIILIIMRYRRYLAVHVVFSTVKVKKSIYFSKVKLNLWSENCTIRLYDCSILQSWIMPFEVTNIVGNGTWLNYVNGAF